MDFMNNNKWWYGVIILFILGLIFVIFKYENTPENASIQTENFVEQSNVLPSSEIILYYAMWCGHSRSFLPEWEKFEEYAKTNLPNIRVSKVRCEDGNETTCSQKGINGYPTVMLYLKSGEEKLYEGDRTLNGLIKFVKS